MPCGLSRLKRLTPLCTSGPRPVQTYSGFMHILLRASFPSSYPWRGTAFYLTILVVLRSSATGVYPQFRRLIVSDDGDVRQLADHTCDPVLTVIGSVEVRQRSGQFASVQIRNGIPWSDLLLPPMPDQFADRSADISRQRPRVCGCRISRRPPQPAAARCHPGGCRRTGPGGPGLAERAGPARSRRGWPRGVTFRGDCRASGGEPQAGEFTRHPGAHRSSALTGFCELAEAARGTRSGSGTAVHRRKFRVVSAPGAGPGS